MFLELHILQNFAPSNLNRDDTGSPKSAEFGGYRRARISSQSIKRAIRQEFDTQDLVPAEHRATRTKRLLASVHSTLVELGRDAEPARQVVSAALGALEIRVADVKEDDREDLGNYKTQYLIYLGAPEIDRIANFCHDNWDTLVTAVEAGSGRSAKKDVRKLVEDAVGKAEVAALKDSLDGGKAADLALFGRMLADIPERNIDAASQVAHAISTHRVGVEFDYYTAVDDLKPDDTAGADMIGTVEFNSACYYRYANIDLRQLVKNLGGDEELAASTVRAFLAASRDAIPTGKQNSFAARNLPSFFFGSVHGGTCWSLANSFVDPVRAANGQSIVDTSVKALDRHWGELNAVYGAPANATYAVCGIGELALEHLAGHRVGTFDAFVESLNTATQQALGA